MRLNSYRYTCVHIEDVENVWSDILGHWSSTHTNRQLVGVTLFLFFTASEFNGSTSREIDKTQKLCLSVVTSSLEMHEELWYSCVQVVWISDRDA